jgi:hypothetical protein
LKKNLGNVPNHTNILKFLKTGLAGAPQRQDKKHIVAILELDPEVLI